MRQFEKQTLEAAAGQTAEAFGREPEESTIKIRSTDRVQKHSAPGLTEEGRRSMAGSRHTDSVPREHRFRSERMINQDGKWFFETREGTFEGPFDSELDARRGIERYIHVTNAKLRAESGQLSLKPL